MTNEKRKERIAAIIREREGYERSGRADRVKACDAALAELGHKAAAPAARSTKRDRG